MKINLQIFPAFAKCLLNVRTLSVYAYNVDLSGTEQNSLEIGIWKVYKFQFIIFFYTEHTKSVQLSRMKRHSFELRHWSELNY